VIGCDVSPEAIARAAARGRAQAASARFLVADVLRDRLDVPTPEVVFARGLLHTFENDQGRRALARAISAILPAGRLWLEIAGSADTPGDPPDAQARGWPRLSLQQIATAVEDRFEIIATRQVAFGTTPGLTDFRAFACAFRRRALQSSAGRAPDVRSTAVRNG
jgi:hypothetical protein